MGKETAPADITKTIAALNSRCGKKRSLFIIGVAMAIISSVVFLGSLALVASSPNAAWMILSLITLIGIIVGITMLFICGSAASVAKRALGMAKAAQSVQGEFVEKPAAAPFEFFKTLKCFSACNKHGKPTNLVRLPGNGEFCSVDYVCFQRDINSQTAYEQTIFVFPAFGNALPDFLLHPRTLLDKAASLVGMKGVKVTDHAGFNKEHVVEGSDPRIAAVFSPELVAGFATKSGIVIEARGGRLIGYWDKKKLKPEEYAESAKFMTAVGNSIRKQLAASAPKAPATAPKAPAAAAKAPAAAAKAPQKPTPPRG